MADPTGTLGGAARKPNDDLLTVVARGGSDFLDRMKQLADARDAHDAAFDRLQLGQDAKAASARAASVLADAETKQQEAVTVLDKARKDAAALIAEAGKQAGKTKDAALADAKTIAAGAVKLKGEADEYAVARKEVADVLLKDAQDKHDQAKAVQTQAVQAKMTHDAAAAAFVSHKQIVEQTKAKLDAKIARLNEVIREVMGD